MKLDRAWVVYPGASSYPGHEKVTVCPPTDLVAEFATGKWAR